MSFFPPTATPPAGLLEGLPVLERAALFLDLDGTLLDIAPTPDSVMVAPGLSEALLALRRRIGDALAIVSGRPVEQVDALLPGIAYAVAGEHGGAIRFSPGAALERPPLPEPPAAWLAAADALAGANPGAMVERKRRGFVLHYRAAPALRDPLHDSLAALIGGRRDFVLLAAHMAWEVRPVGADKGSAVRVLMARAPFTGRLPVFIGDDVTDEDGMDACRAVGGAGLRVDRAFGDAAGVRAWIARAAGQGR